MRTTRPLLALALGVSSALLVLPAAAEPLPVPPPEPVATPVNALLCPADSAGTTVARGSNAGYDRELVVEGRKKKATSTVSGTFATAFGLEGPSCTGASYAITLRSRDGSALGWTQGAASGAPASTVSPDGATVTTTWGGDGSTQSFALDGSTSGYLDPCVRATLAVHGPDGTQRFLATLELCDEGVGSTSYR